MKTVLAAALVFLAGLAGADVTQFAIKPSRTDPEIQTFDTPCQIFVDHDMVLSGKDRHELLVFLPGTGGAGEGATGFMTLAAQLGYHVVDLIYPDEIPATTCDGDPDPQAFERFRMAIIQGGNAAIRGGRMPFSIAEPESIENRLLKLMAFLQQIRPRENWGQFINDQAGIKWPAIAVAGQSQGGGHAALIGLKFPVERVLCFGSPKDYSTRLNAQAAWYGEASATPKSQFFAFNHVQDPKGCTPEQLLLNLHSLLGDFGTVGQVDSEEFPYHHARVLYTAYPQVEVEGQESRGAGIAHTSPISTANAERWKQVWTYMLTEGGPTTPKQ
jgi:hypothetical protein